MTGGEGQLGDRIIDAEDPRQQEMPFAFVEGSPVTELPRDLYIPPHALEVFLETFEGPLDLLLYLIKRQNLDILDIPIAEITRQYMEYVDLMKEMRLELAAEYLVMAAMLAEIKSRMLLPRPESEDGEEEDPRADLVRRLQEYERYKQAAEALEALPRVGRDIFEAKVLAPYADAVKVQPKVSVDDLISAMRDVLARAEMFSHHHVQMEPLSVRERMSIILGAVKGDQFIEFSAMFTPEEGRQGVVVTLLAVLELIKDSLIELVQSRPYGPIHIKATGS
ncbi:MAG: ScpA family protein [Gammaproteobacteria bacterium]|nr:ScpA family protein [Gammaproteobacteria bacterium]